MKLKFEYKKFLLPQGKFLLLPVVPIGLEYNGHLIKYEALIDSGADVNVFPWDIAELFGFTKKDAKEKVNIHGISGKPILTYFFDTIIVVGGSSRHIARCGFAEGLPATNWGFLGQKGFFDNYRIEFDYQRESITLWNNA